jgi:phospholipase/carboxylesterase
VPAIAHGADPSVAPLAAVLIHGRGRSAAEMIGVAERIALPQIAWRALRAPGGSWYPGGFMDPIKTNQPKLDQTLARVDREVRTLDALGFPRQRIALIGFSQGACIASEYAYRHPRRWAGLIAFTGGLFGPEGTAWKTPDLMAGTPVLLSNSDQDEWVPWPRVEETAAVFRSMGAEVTLKLYPGRDHLVGDDEIEQARAILQHALAGLPALPVLEEES